MQRDISIPTNDGHLINGTLDYKKAKKDTLIILVHGLSDSKDHRLVFNAAKYFKNKGFHTFRFSLYDEGEKNRSLDECSVGTFIADTNAVLDYFAGEYKKIFVACHSLGFVTLECDLAEVRGVALWDPALSLKKERVHELEYEPRLDAYFIDWGVRFIISKQLKIDWENISDRKLLGKVTKPLCILMAANNDLRIGWQKNLSILKSPYVYKEIKGASHGFVEEGKEDELFSTTYQWMKKQ